MVKNMKNNWRKKITKELPELIKYCQSKCVTNDQCKEFIIKFTTILAGGGRRSRKVGQGCWLKSNAISTNCNSRRNFFYSKNPLLNNGDQSENINLIANSLGSKVIQDWLKWPKTRVNNENSYFAYVGKTSDVHEIMKKKMRKAMHFLMLGL